MIRKLSFHFMRIFYNPYDGLLYFQGVEGIRIKYGLDGKYVGKMKVPLSTGVSPQFVVPLDLTTFCAFLRIEVDGRRKE